MKRLLHISWILVVCILSSFSLLEAQIIETDNYFVNDVAAISGESGDIWIGTSESGIVIRNPEGRIINTYNQSGTGLIDDHINCISIDSEQNKWIGTDEGISIFDGVEWMTITRDDGLSSNKVKAIVFTDDNMAYIGSDKGLDIYDMAEEKVIKGLNESDGLASNIITSLALDEDSLWIGSISGVNIYDGEKLTELQPPDSISITWINTIAVDGKNAWIGSDNGLTHYDGNSCEFFDSKNQLLSNEIKDIAIGNDSLWLATNNAITLYTNGTFTHFQKSNSNLLSNSHNAIWTNDKGETWAGNYKGISKFAKGKWSCYRELKSNKIRNATTLGNSIWFSTNNGLTAYENTTWQTYTIEDGMIDNSITDISFDKATEMWIATESGITHVAENSTKSYTTNDGLVDNCVKHTAIDSSGKKWFGTPSGISVYDDGQWFNYTASEEKIESNNITDIETDPAGVVWISTTNGVSSFEDGAFTYFSTEDGLVSDSVNTIFIDSTGKKWFGTQKGISTYDGSSWNDITSKDNLPFKEVTALAESSSDAVLIGGNEGIAVYENDTFRLVNKQCGLICNKIRSISHLNDKTWIGTEEGITKMERIVNHAPNNILLENQSINETYPAESTISGLIAEDPDPDNQHKFSLVEGGEDNNLFTISHDELIIQEATDFEQKQEYSLKIQTKDEYGEACIKEFTLSISNIAPEFTQNSFTILENEEEGTKIGTLALNENKDTNSVKFEILEGNTNNAFAIDSVKGVLRVNKPSMMDYESYQEFDLKTKVTDGKYADTTNVKIHLEDILNEGFNVLFVVENSSGEYIKNADVNLDGYGTLTTLSNGQVIYGSVQPNVDITYTASAAGYKADTGMIHLQNQNIEEYVVLEKKQSKDDDEETDTDTDSVSTAVNHIQGKEVSLYPNPVAGSFYVKGKNIANSHLTIKSLNGKTVINRRITRNNERISVGNLNSGIYIVEIKDDNSAIRKKIIIK
jgi:ligand-binding sensor domain-containing protein